MTDLTEGDMHKIIEADCDLHRDISKKDLIEMLNELKDRITELPQQAMFAPVTHADFASLLILLSAILRAD